MSNVDDRYKAALIEEHDSYKRSGRTEDAKGVARVLKDQYDYDVEEQSDSGEEKPKLATTLPERADQSSGAEAAVDPKPRRSARVKPGQGDAK